MLKLSETKVKSERCYRHLKTVKRGKMLSLIIKLCGSMETSSQSVYDCEGGTGARVL